MRDYLEMAESLFPERQMIGGHGLRKKPKYFFVGNAPTHKDMIMGHPFSGPTMEVIDKALIVISQQYVKAGREPISRADCYYTYFVKCLATKEEATEEFVQSWLPVIKQEMMQVQPQEIVVLGDVARPFIGEFHSWLPLWKEQKGLVARMTERFLGKA